MLEYIAIAIFVSCAIIVIREKFGADISAFFQTEAGGRTIKYGLFAILTLGAILLAYFTFTSSHFKEFFSNFS